MFNTIYLAQNTFRKMFPVPKSHVMNKLRSSESKAFCKVTLTHIMKIIYQFHASAAFRPILNLFYVHKFDKTSVRETSTNVN